MTRWRALGGFCWVVTAGVLVAFTLADDTHHLREAVRWRALEDIVSEGPDKPVLLEFDAPWCAPCREMRTRVYSQRAVGTFIEEHFFPVRVEVDDPDRTPEPIRDLLAAYQVSGFPTLLVVDHEGQVLRRHRGYADAGQLLEFLRNESWGGWQLNSLSALELTVDRLRAPSEKRAKVVLFRMYASPCVEPEERSFSYRIVTHGVLPHRLAAFLNNGFEFLETRTLPWGNPPSEVQACRNLVQAFGVEALPAALVFTPDGRQLLAKFEGDVGGLYPFLRSLYPDPEKPLPGFLRWTPRHARAAQASP